MNISMLMNISMSTHYICLQSMLSAVLQHLYSMNKERSSAVKAKLVEVCSSAFPDIQPWQVKKMCHLNELSNEESVVMADLYYSYLSLLLIPSDGFDAARRQPQLVMVRVLVRYTCNAIHNNSHVFCFYLTGMV
jgi:hypothetical protein